MATAIHGAGPTDWSMTRTDDGQREYKVTIQVRSGILDGPFNVLNTSGLPLPGSTWDYGDDEDPWAYCKAGVQITPRLKGESNKLWDLTFSYSTRPDKRCQETAIEDPLMEPQKVSGAFTKTKEEAARDKDNNPIVTSSHEMIRGPQVEFDKGRPTVKIEQNVADLELDVICSLMDKLNDAPLWGLSARCVKFSNCTWERKYYGSCSVYYTRTLEFETNDQTFDRQVLDEGNKVLKGHWHPTNGKYIIDIASFDEDDIAIYADKDLPQDFIRFTDRQNNPARVILDGNGRPADVDTETLGGTPTAAQPPAYITVQAYGEDDLTLLGIPSSL